jgi:hypothetical protein
MLGQESFRKGCPSRYHSQNSNLCVRVYKKQAHFLRRTVLERNSITRISMQRARISIQPIRIIPRRTQVSTQRACICARRMHMRCNGMCFNVGSKVIALQEVCIHPYQSPNTHVPFRGFIHTYIHTYVMYIYTYIHMSCTYIHTYIYHVLW